MTCLSDNEPLILWWSCAHNGWFMYHHWTVETYLDVTLSIPEMSPFFVETRDRWMWFEASGGGEEWKRNTRFALKQHEATLFRTLFYGNSRTLTWICLRGSQKIKHINYRFPKWWIFHWENKKITLNKPMLIMWFLIQIFCAPHRGAASLLWLAAWNSLTHLHFKELYLCRSLQ